jgi:hypothetical protein
VSARETPALILLVALSFLAPNGAHARCNARRDPRWAIHQSLVLLLNPMGAEHTVRVGLCVPLYASEDVVFADNHFEAGVTAYNAPIYAIGGGYAQLGLASFLFVRVELSALGIWPIPVDAAGYHARSSYSDSFRQEDLAPEGQSASGWTARFFVLLRGAVDLTPSAALIAFSALWLDYLEVGPAPFWVDVRDDVITARSDWVLANESVLAVSAIIPGGPHARFGAYSALRAVPASGYVGHQVGPIVMLSWPVPDPRVVSLDLFIRLGVYTAHQFRTAQLATLAGIGIDWDLGGL